jgi:hypothetical protein
MHDHPDEQRLRELVVRRLEAFPSSGIVIGFNLAQLGRSLVTPEHAIDVVQRPVGRFWWTHFKISQAAASD